jgi:hypothetical protein
MTTPDPAPKVTLSPEVQRIYDRVIQETKEKFAIELYLEQSGLLQQNGLALAKHLCQKFHSVALQLQRRHDARNTIVINDEYDVQDLLHSILKIHFDDIRPEQWTPGYAGGATRMDFLLKNEKMAIEVKKTGKNHCSPQIGDELIIDIAHYQQHPDCKALLCFVYDPAELIANPAELMNDLSGKHGELIVEVFVGPKR